MNEKETAMQKDYIVPLDIEPTSKIDVSPTTEQSRRQFDWDATLTNEHSQLIQHETGERQAI